MNTDIDRKDGHVTQYGLALGYVDITHVPTPIGDARIRLTSNGCSYDVHVWAPDGAPDFDRWAPFGSGRTHVGWAQFSSLTEARRAARRYATRIRRGEELWREVID